MQDVEFTTGCYRIRYTPRSAPPEVLYYEGTMRITADDRLNGVKHASLDLYAHDRFAVAPGAQQAHGASDVPVFARAAYRYYMRSTEVLEPHAVIRVRLQQFHQERAAFRSPGTLTLVFRSGQADVLAADIINDGTGTVVGALTAEWICKHLRSAVIEIDKVPGAPFPKDNQAGQDWVEVFRRVNWSVRAKEDNPGVQEPQPGHAWTHGQFHRALRDQRDNQVNLDTAWHYHLLCVGRIEGAGFERGVMYDVTGGDDTELREGAAIASDWEFPSEDKWGEIHRGRKIGETSAYFRTAVHEIGHAMGLDHNWDDGGFMNTTDAIAERGNGGFSANVEWRFSPRDAEHLRHAPDVVVRPGTTVDKQSLQPDSHETPAAGIDLHLAPLLNAVPFGAPVRVDLVLKNTSAAAQMVPGRLSLKSGCVSGAVADAQGNSRRFSALLRREDQNDIAVLEKGATRRGSITLLRGRDGALFPHSGLFTVRTRVSWFNGRAEVFAFAETRVTVTPPVNDAHRIAALKVLTTPETLHSLAIGGDQFSRGNAAIEAALADETLAPHYEVVAIKRQSRSFQQGITDVAGRLPGAGSVLSEDEIEKLIQLLMAVPTAGAREYIESLAGILKRKLGALAGAGHANPKRVASLEKLLGSLHAKKPIAVSDKDVKAFAGSDRAVASETK